MIFAVINDQTNIVKNIVVLDEGSQWTPPPGDYIVDITGTEVGIGWIYSPQSGEWTPPSEPESNLDVNQSGSQPNVIV